jgi:hypothetical protein
MEDHKEWLKKDIQLKSLRRLLPSKQITAIKTDAIGDVKWDTKVQCNFIRMSIFSWTMNQLVRGSISASLARKSRKVAFWDVMAASKAVLHTSRMQLPRSLANCKNVMKSLSEREAKYTSRDGKQYDDNSQQNRPCVYLNKSRFHRYFNDMMVNEYQFLTTEFSQNNVGATFANVSVKYPLVKRGFVNSLM